VLTTQHNALLSAAPTGSKPLTKRAAPKPPQSTVIVVPLLSGLMKRSGEDALFGKVMAEGS
jgi:hypothetical protein